MPDEFSAQASDGFALVTLVIIVVKVYVKVQPYLRTSRHKQIRIGAFQRGNISQLWSRGFKVTSL